MPIPKPKTQRAGQLTSNTSQQGKKIDVWTFRPNVSGGLHLPETISFDVVLLKNMEFKVSSEQLSKTRFSELQGENLKELKEKALEAAQNEFDLHNQLIWTDWLEIKIEELPRGEVQREEITGAQARVTYSSIPRAETSDGNAFTLNNNGCLVRFPDNITVERPQDGENSWGMRKTDPEKIAEIKNNPNLSDAEKLYLQLSLQDQRTRSAQFVYQPDTPETRAGLGSIIDAIETINLRLQQFLHPQEITQTLQRAASNRQLLLSGSHEQDPSDQPSSPRNRRPR